jgi:hypothetical protein
MTEPDPRDVLRTAATAERALELLALLVDPDPCWFDHNGGCQAHGFLSLEPGESCPNQDAKTLLRSITQSEGA